MLGRAADKRQEPQSSSRYYGSQSSRNPRTSRACPIKSRTTNTAHQRRFCAEPLSLKARSRASAAIRERSKVAYGSSLLDARLVLLAIIKGLVSLRAGQPGSTSPEISERLALTVAAIQGVGSTETLISEGQYVKAAAALRQDLEIVARLREVDEGLAKEGKVANIKHGPRDLDLFTGI